MGMLKRIGLISLVIQSFHLVSITICQPDFYYYICMGDNYTSTDAYKANLDTVLSSISSTAETTNLRFYNFSIGLEPDRATGIGLCRGDLTPVECRRCLKDSTIKLPQLCPSQKEAIGWYDLCTLRYSNRSFLGLYENVPSHSVYRHNGSSVGEYGLVLRNLWDSLKLPAASGDSQLKFATGEANVTTTMTLYALVQCTPDLSQINCTQCLNYAIDETPCCDLEHAWSATPSCNIRFEKYRFYDLVRAASPPLPVPSTPGTG